MATTFVATADRPLPKDESATDYILLCLDGSEEEAKKLSVVPLARVSERRVLYGHVTAATLAVLGPRVTDVSLVNATASTQLGVPLPARAHWKTLSVNGAHMPRDAEFVHRALLEAAKHTDKLIVYMDGSFPIAKAEFIKP